MMKRLSATVLKASEPVLNGPSALPNRIGIVSIKVSNVLMVMSLLGCFIQRMVTFFPVNLTIQV